MADAVSREYEGNTKQLQLSRNALLQAMGANMARVRDQASVPMLVALSCHRFAQACAAFIMLKECADIAELTDIFCGPHDEPMPLWERLEEHVRETKVALSVYEALETLRGLGNKELFEYATTDIGFDPTLDTPAATNALIILSRFVLREASQGIPVKSQANFAAAIRAAHARAAANKQAANAAAPVAAGTQAAKGLHRRARPNERGTLTVLSPEPANRAVLSPPPPALSPPPASTHTAPAAMPPRTNAALSPSKPSPAAATTPSPTKQLSSSAPLTQSPGKQPQQPGKPPAPNATVTPAAPPPAKATNTAASAPAKAAATAQASPGKPRSGPAGSGIPSPVKPAAAASNAAKGPPQPPAQYAQHAQQAQQALPLAPPPPPAFDTAASRAAAHRTSTDTSGGDYPGRAGNSNAGPAGKRGRARPKLKPTPRDPAAPRLPARFPADIVCRDWLHGTCARVNCPLKHADKCPDNNRGGCGNPVCPYAHVRVCTQLDCPDPDGCAFDHL